MHSTPEQQLEKGKTDRWPHDRLTQYGVQGVVPPMVEITHGYYLLEAMIDLRPARFDGMGSVNPPDWTELRAYGKLTENLTEAWEFQVVMKMCKAYISGWHEGKDMLSISPMERTEEEDG